VLFNEDHTLVKIIDMGISSEFDTSNEMMYVGEAGTFRYMSPEQFEGKICLKTDVWSFGCILLEFCTGKRPYNEILKNELVGLQITEQKVTPLDYCFDEKNYCSAYDIISENLDLKELLEDCFQLNYIKRPTAYVLKERGFFDTSGKMKLY
jgi:serine/threonine protein kinase